MQESASDHQLATKYLYITPFSLVQHSGFASFKHGRNRQHTVMSVDKHSQ